MCHMDCIDCREALLLNPCAVTPVFNTCTDKLLVNISHSFEAGIANTISSFK